MKKFVQGRLLLNSVNTMDDTKTSIRFNNLVESASLEEVNQVKVVVESLVQDPIESVQAVYTYEFI